MRVICTLTTLALSGCLSLSGLGEDGVLGDHEPPSKQAQSYAHYMTAVVYERSNRYKNATQEMRKAADLAPEAVTPMLKLIRAYVRDQDYENARLICRRALSQLPDVPMLWIMLGEIQHRLKNLDEAVQAFEKAIELAPDSVLGYDRLVALEEESNDLIAAINIYQRLIEMRPNDAGLHYQLGLNLARINDTKGARAALEKALELKPDLRHARFILGVVYLDTDENEKARAQFARIVEDRPNDLDARDNLAGALARLGQYSAAIDHLTQIASKDGGDAKYPIAVALLLLRAGRYDEASEMAPPDDAPIFGALLHGLARKHAGLPWRPVVDSLDTLEGDLDAECNALLNELLYPFGVEDTGQFLLDALEDLRKEGVRSKTVEVVRGRISIALERYQDAEKVLLAALRRFKPDKYIHYYLATVYESLDQFEGTEHHLLAYLALEPDDPDVLNFLGYLYAVENVKLDQAKTLLNRALELDPDNGFYLDSLGWICYRKGDAARAIELIRKAILVLDNDDAEVRDHLGDAYLLEGDVERAVAEWERARRLDPAYEGVQEKIDMHRKGEE